MPDASSSTATDHDHYSDAHLRRVLRQARVIAMVGASANTVKASYFVMKYLQIKGHRVIPVNPAMAGKPHLGETFVASLADIPVPVDMVDVFRNSEAAGGIVDEAIAIGAKMVWMQLGVRNDEGARRAEAAGLTVVMNRCPKIETARLNGELGWSGINTGIITSRRRL